MTFLVMASNVIFNCAAESVELPMRVLISGGHKCNIIVSVAMRVTLATLMFYNFYLENMVDM